MIEGTVSYSTDLWLPYAMQDPYAFGNNGYRTLRGSTLIGTACGLAGGLYASRFVETMLFEVTARDVSSLALPLGTLLLTALVAAAVPAWRAARVDPVIALRNE